jgi:hypothetical protein
VVQAVPAAIAEPVPVVPVAAGLAGEETVGATEAFGADVAMEAEVAMGAAVFTAVVVGLAAAEVATVAKTPPESATAVVVTWEATAVVATPTAAAVVATDPATDPP